MCSFSVQVRSEDSRRQRLTFPWSVTDPSMSTTDSSSGPLSTTTARSQWISNPLKGSHDTHHPDPVQVLRSARRVEISGGLGKPPDPTKSTRDGVYT